MNWKGLKEIQIKRKNPILWALIGCILYIAAVFGGSELQFSILKLPLNMGWMMQILSALVVVGIAFYLGHPKELLAWKLPENGWLMPTLIVVSSSLLLSIFMGYLYPEPSFPKGFEYFAYEATMPGVGEELGFRGLVLGLLLTYAYQNNWSKKGYWIMFLLPSIPFGLLHVLEVTGTEAIVTFFYTGAIAIGLGWLRMKTGSLFTCVLAHNLINVVGTLLTLLIYK